MIKLPTLYPCAHASRNPPSIDILPLVGGEVRVVAGSGSRLPKASKSTNGAMAAFVGENQAEPKLLLGAMYIDIYLPHDFLSVWCCCYCRCCRAATDDGPMLIQTGVVATGWEKGGVQGHLRYD